MAKRKKTTEDAKLIALKDGVRKATMEYEKSYSRMKRAFNRLEKARKKVVRLQKAITKREQELLTASTNEGQVSGP